MDTLTIGYVTLDEVNNYISSFFLSDNKQRVKWEALSDADKEVLINKGFEDIENLKYMGYKTDKNQTSKWPRCGFFNIPNNTVPIEIKKAQMLEAVSYVGKDNSAYKALKNGVSSEVIDDLTTTYNVNVKRHLQSEEAYDLIRKYVKMALNVR